MMPAQQTPSDPTPIAPRPSRRRALVFGAVGIAVALGAVLAWRATHRAPTVRYETVPVGRGRIVAQVTATGTLSAIVTVQVGTQVSGRIAKLYVDYNSPVKKNQLIAKIDPDLFQAALEQARATWVAAKGDLSQAKANALNASRQLVRNRALFEKKLIAPQDLDTAQANADATAAAVDGAQGRLAQAAAALDQAKLNLAYTNIVSPIDGSVISRNVDVGQTVAASLQAPVLFVIAEDLQKMQVDTSVAEADIGKLRDGMEAMFTVDAFPTRKFKGVVRQIRNAAQTVQNVVTYDAVVDVANPDFALRPGMTANVTFVYAERTDVLRVPNAALRFRPPPDLQLQARGAAAGAGKPPEAGSGKPQAASRPEGGEGPDRKTVFVLRGERPEPMRVRIGVSDGSFTELVEGDLHEGDRLVTDASGAPASAPATPGGGPRPPRIL